MFQHTFEDEDMDDVELSDDNNSEKQSYNPGLPENVKDVFTFQNEDDEDSDENDQVSTDFQSDMPDTRAWGKKKKSYYSSDYVDTDLGALSEKEQKNAEIEEEEAKTIQKRLARELDDIDFGLNIKSTNQLESKTSTHHIIKIDRSKLTTRQKLELLEKESPEFTMLVRDIKDQLVEIKTTFGPYLKLLKTKNHSNNTALTFVQTKYQVVLHYCVNILFYLTLKSKHLFINPHPVIKRLAQYRQLLNQMNSVQDTVLSNLEKILQASENQKSLISQTEIDTTDLPISNRNSEQEKNLNHSANMEHIEDDNNEEEMEAAFVDNMIINENNDPAERRLITYQMKKNKGLTPHRSKEQRNPRVKHRNKYRKAQIRRKGAVREARTEIHRYAGEVSGIKAGLRKSVPLM